jgi:hypothetical protein
VPVQPEDLVALHLELTNAAAAKFLKPSDA